ncbi:MAG: response regulator transcription factor [Oscillospiraceae bacterium]|nr:response regulator transcription factor [Oscillospiraceae bacterium]
MIDVIIVEDNRLILDYLTNLLSSDGRFRIAGRYDDAFEAERVCARGGIELVLMDVQTLHNHSGLAAGERIRARGGGTKVVAVTSLVDPEVLARARSGGADSLWYKDHGSADILNVIERTLAGERVFPDSAPSVELKDMLSGDITPRQLSVLRRFVMGMTYDEIAKEMKISRDGVRWNIEQIVQKGGFENKHELMAAVLCNKYIVTSLLESEDE